MSDAKYVMDASILLERGSNKTFQYEAFPTHWDNFDKLVKNGEIIAPLYVKTELERKADKDLDKWLSKNSKMFKPFTVKIQESLNYLSTEFPEWYESINRNETSSNPIVIAFAHSHGINIITQEKFNLENNPLNYTIPTISYKMGAHIYQDNLELTETKGVFDCINFTELIKREKLYEI